MKPGQAEGLVGAGEYGIGMGSVSDSFPESYVFSQAPEAPTALETLRIVQRGEHSLRLRWERVPGAHGFRLRWQPEGERCPSRRLGTK